MALIKCPGCGREMSERAVKCPHCGMTMVDNKSALFQSKEKESSTVEENDTIRRLREDQSTMQEQVDALKDEAMRLNNAIAADEDELEVLKAEKQQLMNEIAQAKVSEDKAKNLHGEISQLQQQAEDLRNEVQKQQNMVAASKVELDNIRAQVEVAKKEQKQTSRLSKGERIVVWCLSIAIVAVAIWIAWMVLTYNGII